MSVVPAAAPDPATARAAVLARIRQALAAGAAPLPPVPDWAAPVHPPLPGAEAGAGAGVGADDLAVVFAERFVRAGGEFYYAATAEQLGAQLRDYLLAAGHPRFFVWEPAMQALLRAAQVPFVADETDFLPHADAGLTSCEALVARSGSVLVSAATAAGRRLSIYPDQHLVLARPAQVVAEIGAALARIQQHYGAALPSMISLTTGPSRTADIEKTLVLGAHGPRRLALFMLEDDASLNRGMKNEE